MGDEIDMICKDMFNVCSRLFNHRAVLAAESKFLVKELETKKTRDPSKVFWDIDQSIEKVKGLIPECAELLNDKAQHIHAKVVNAASSGLDILEDRSQEYSKVRAEHKAEVEKEWEQFMIEMSKAQNDVLKKHDERMAKLYSPDLNNFKASKSEPTVSTS